MNCKKSYIHLKNDAALNLLIAAAIPCLIQINMSLAILVTYLYLTALLFKLKKKSEKNKKKLILPVLFISIIIFNSSRIIHQKNHYQKNIKNNQSIIIQGLIQQKKNQILIKDHKTKLYYQVQTKDKTNPLYKKGNELIIEGLVKKGKKPENPGQFNQEKYFKSQNILGKLKPNKVTYIKTHPLPLLQIYANKLNPLIKTIHEKNLPYPYNELLLGLVFGQQNSALPEELKENIKKSGLLHLMVVSGMQVALLSGLLLKIMSQMPLPTILKIMVLIISNLFFYTLTGGGASIARAVSMNIISATLILINHRTAPKNPLLVSIAILQLIAPTTLLQIGAQLSIAATIACMYLVPLMAQSLKKKGLPFSSLIATSLSPICCTTPLIWYHFNTLSWVGFISNLGLIWWVEWLVITDVIAMLCYPVSHWVTDTLHQACLLGLIGLEQIASIAAKLPGSNLCTKKPTLLAVLACYAGLLTWLSPKINQKNKKNLLLICGLIIIQPYVIQALIRSPLKITLLSVGQGECIVIQTPKGQSFLVDTGPIKINWKTKQKYFDAGQSIVIPYLNHEGINTIDALFITHYDQDHVGGLKSLKRSKTIKTIIDNRSLSRSNHESAYTLTPEKDLIIKILHPLTHSFKKKNNRSLVLKISYHQFSLLLTGDIEKKVEHQLIERYPNDLQAQILKVPHHGSNTSSSSSFINTVNPQITLISCGKMNRYRHPHPKVLDRLKNTQVLRTDQMGAIQIKIKNRRCQIQSYTKETLSGLKN